MSANRLYFHLKPYLPWRLRMAMRQTIAHRQRQKYQEVWPINEAAGRPPAGWPGWPDGKKFAFVITHDVEGPAGLAKCRKLMALDQQLGFRSSFNFVPEGDYAVSRELRGELAHDGFEVGVHDLHHDGKLYKSRRGFAENARWINHYLSEWGATGFRSGFMLRQMNWLHDLDIQYDTSTFDTDPFEPQPDGAGTIFPFWVPRPEAENGRQKEENGNGKFAQLSTPDKSEIRNQKSEIRNANCAPNSSPAFRKSEIRNGYVELPYTLAQDSTLFLVLRESTPEIWLKKLDWIARHGGMALVNIHPDYIRFPGDPVSPGTYPVEHYLQLLQHLKARHAGNYWQPLPREMAGFVSDFQHLHGNGIIQEFSLHRATQELETAGKSTETLLTASSTTRAATAVSLPTSRFNQVPLENPAPRISNPDKQPRLPGKRIAVLLFSYYPSDPRPKRAAEALAQEGAEIDFLCLKGRPAEAKREMTNGLNVFRVSLKRRRGGKLVYFYQYGVFLFSAFIFLAWRSLRRRYDLVHVHNMPDVLVFSALVPKLLGAKIILDLHDPMPELMMTIYQLPEQSLSVRLVKRAEKWSIRFADLVLTPNVAFQKLFASRSCPADKIQIMMNSPNEKTFPFRPVFSIAAPRKPSDRFVILYHGSLVHRHGLDIAIDALAVVRKSIPNATITICGENTPYFEQVMETVKDRGLTDAVHYLGMRNQQQIAEAIEQCDLGVIPNRRSIFTEINMPTRIFEYLALAKPVIAPATQGIQDYFNGQNLIFFEPDNVADLARKIEYAFLHPRETKDIVERGQVIYQKHKWQLERTTFLRFVGDLVCVEKR